MFGVPLEKIRKGNPEYALRQKGKVAVLALGYQGGVGALISMEASNIGMTGRGSAGDCTTVETNKWPVRHSLEGGGTLRKGDDSNRTPDGGRKSSFTREIDTHNDFLTIQLPSGRKLFYVRPAVEQDSMTFWGQNQTTREVVKTRNLRRQVSGKHRPGSGEGLSGREFTQLEAAGYNIVFHIHDEVIIDARQDQHLADVVEIMKKPVSWCWDLPLNADGWEGEYFTKD